MDKGIKPAELDKTGEGSKLNNPDNVVAINVDKLSSVDDDFIVEACEAMQQIELRRTELNEQAADIRRALSDIGIPPAAFNAGYARYKKTSNQRAAQDAGYAKVCKAMGVGYQPGLFG